MGNEPRIPCSREIALVAVNRWLSAVPGRAFQRNEAVKAECRTAWKDGTEPPGGPFGAQQRPLVLATRYFGRGGCAGERPSQVPGGP